MSKKLNSYSKYVQIALIAGAGSLIAQSAVADSETNSTTTRPSSSVLASEHQRVSSGIILKHISNRTQAIALRRNGAPAAKTSGLYEEFGSGVSAGDGNNGVTGFVSLSYNKAEDDFVTTAYDSDTTSFSLGGDKSINDKLTVGVSGGYSSTDTSTTFNSGGSDTTGWNLAPYLSYAINQNISFDASVGYSTSEADNKRVAAGTTITGTQDSNSKFLSLGANYSHWIENIGLSGNTGYTYSKSSSDAFTESNGTAIASSNSTFRQVHIGGQAMYYMENMMPSISLAWQKEVGKKRMTVGAGQAAPSNDSDEFVLGIGISFFGEGPLTGGINGSKTFSRDNFDSTSISANIAIAF